MTTSFQNALGAYVENERSEPGELLGSCAGRCACGDPCDRAPRHAGACRCIPCRVDDENKNDSS